MRTAFESEYVEYVQSRLPALRRTAYLVLGDGHRADDAVQDALTVLYRRWGRLGDVANLDAYVHTMVVRACLAYRRRGWSRVLLRGDPPDSVVDSDSGRVDERLMVREALNRLPVRQRVVVMLRFLCDLPVADVAQVLGCSEGTVKSRTHHGLRALRAALGDGALSSLSVTTAHQRRQA
ncbi:SigE family RNA polymerase sigma factor [Dactylosporangium sp. NPDC000244]|uniref:SigE family RNA polymerase sigma factor n=1 Tax=Dactylosporangium sp. NPDC000244 TaxID=3154365 RepID=UPI00331F57F8